MFIRGISMKKLLEILRLNFDKQLSSRMIARSVNVSKTTVIKYITLFNSSGLTWPLEEKYLNEDRLLALLQNVKSPNTGTSNTGGAGTPEGNPKHSKASGIDFATIHHELKKHKHLTMMLLWEELHLKNEISCSYGHLTLLYRKWLEKQPSSMRQMHKAGEKVFVDYSGDTIPIYDENDNIVHNAQIFVGVLGASNYIYAEATLSQKLCDWTMSHVRMFEHFGGAPELVVPDNLKSGVIKAHRYDPDITPAYNQMLSHYSTAAMPARAFTPKDKALAENGVLIVQRWILAKLRKIKFTNLHELNNKLHELVEIANNKKMQKYPYTRRELFEMLDKPALQSLPITAYVYREYKKVRVSCDYHIELDGHYYSVPHNLVNVEIDLWYTANLVECYYKNICVAKHIRSYAKKTKTTIHEHMPIGHQKYAEMTPAKALESAKAIGIATSIIVEQIFTESPHPAIACRKSYGFLKLAKKYGNNALEDTCNYAINIGIYNYKNIEILLNKQLVKPVMHCNIRGAAYYS